MPHSKSPRPDLPEPMSINHSHAVVLLLALGAPGAWAATDFAPAGARAILEAEFRYESRGRKEDRNDLREWQIKRQVTMSAELAAKPPTSLPAMQAPDSAAQARIGAQQAHIAKLSADMAPMMAGAEKILAKCGEDEACLERESAKMGAALANDPKTAARARAGDETAKLFAPGAPRYQAWQAQAQNGRYEIEERVHLVYADPICMSLPRARCTRDERRDGAGPVPGPLPEVARSKAAAGFAGAEFDFGGNIVLLRLPVPLNALPYTEVITSNEPGASKAAAERGRQQKQHVFKEAGDSPFFRLPLKGGWRSQSGEETIRHNGKGGEGGTLKVRWRLTAG